MNARKRDRNTSHVRNTTPSTSIVLLITMTNLMPIIRVRRKRSAGPHAALIMETKKRKEEGSSDGIDEPVEYDYYKIYRGSVTEAINQWNSDLELRFATEEEQALLLGNSDSESECVADDDDDSNDENNWRNDYPEEEDFDETEDEDADYDSEGIRYVGEPRMRLPGEYEEFELDRMRRRLEMFDMEEYEGEEDTSDDESILNAERW
ncbi:hypothetical protein DICVIV_08499 [Dictyocaulus viviparus]|uniref:Probable RNA polymerase II nuclear localization protein SLC7A6OS n=1 Tax=Dictyocaulus viviparus TaxID=29172 RepID=A0A0D8XLP4_DICVI|nr:hypothetical protein DICVIV_08499 [Dictyocaulus viviparus]